jgi:hypothetical protein
VKLKDIVDAAGQMVSPFGRRIRHAGAEVSLEDCTVIGA